MFLTVFLMAPKILTVAELAERQRVGATLRTLRATRGWKLGDFATELDISYAYLSNIEAGRKPLPDHLLARAAKLLDVEQIAIKHPSAAVA
jgi:transcriptional regulator with XRE-family HTH domain